MAHQVAILVYPGFELLDASGPASVFAAANDALIERGRKPFYAVETISAGGGLVQSRGGVAIETRALRRVPVKTVDTLLVAGAREEPIRVVMGDPLVRRWLPRCARVAKRFGSVCAGTFVLATLGLLDGRRAATHWSAAAPLTKFFPRVSVDPEALYVVDGRIWTSAGVTTGIDMALAIVSHDLDASIANQAAEWLVLYARRPGYQSQFSPVLRAQARADNPFADLIAWLPSNLQRRLDVPTLAAEAGLSERNFYRKFMETTGETPARYIETVRLDAARMLLAKGLPLKTIAAEVGLSPTSRFTKAFERRFGVSPRLFREMHARVERG